MHPGFGNQRVVLGIEAGARAQYERLGACVLNPSPCARLRGRSPGSAATSTADDKDKVKPGQAQCGRCKDRNDAEATPARPPPSLLDQCLELVGRLRCLGRCLDLDEASIASTMLDVRVDRTEGVDLHEQVAAEIRRAIADGEAQPGDRLPPAGDLAAVIGVNKNTVLRALRVLRDEGLLEFRRGRGVSVAATPDRAEVVSRAKDLVEFARQRGYRREELAQLINDLS